MNFLEINRKGTSKNLDITYNLLATDMAPTVFYKKTGINTAHITEWSLNETDSYVEVVYITGKVYQFGAAATMATNATFAAPVSAISGVEVTDNQHLYELFDALMEAINS